MTADIVQPTTATETTVPADRERGLTPRAARRLAVAERVLYGAGGVLTAVGPQTDAWALHAAALGAGAGALWHLWRRTTGAGPGLLVSCQRALPVLGLSGAYAAALVAPGTTWWEYAVPAAAALLAGLAVPVTRSLGLRRAVEELPERIADQAAVLETATEPDQDAPADPYVAGLQELWEASTATGDTRLTEVVQYAPDRPDFAAVILAPAGQAVPSWLDARAVAAVFDVPVEAVALAPVEGRGPGRLAVRVAPTLAPTGEQRDGLEGLWEQKVSGPGGVAPGMTLADYRVEDNRIVVRVEAADDRLIDLPRLRLARALGVDDPDLLMVETDGLGVGIVSVYREHPLISVREATAEDLRMGKDGRFALGLRHDGRPARMPLYDPELGALTDLLVGAPGSGKSVTLLTILAAERISGVVSIVADAQDGMSLPEANGRTYHFGAGRAAFGATLAAACAVADHREAVSAANGWGSFALGDPWPLANITLDETNRVLASDADVPDEFRKWVAGMIGRAQITFRKLGMGLRIAGQSIHVADLGDSEKIRANAKQGTVWLGRVNSSMTRRMASDMADPGVEITPIPRFFGAGGAGEVEAAWSGEEAPPGPVTAGTAWMIQGGHPTLMRVWRAVKKNRSYPGLIRLLESASLPGLTPEEDAIFRTAYAQGLALAENLLTGPDRAALVAELETVVEALDAHAATGRSSTPPAPPRTLRDRILAALVDGPRKTREIRQAVGVGTEGGPASGSVDNELTKLREEGHVARVGHGTWALPDQN